MSSHDFSGRLQVKTREKIFVESPIFYPDLSHTSLVINGQMYNLVKLINVTKPDLMFQSEAHKETVAH